jgi:hypothetical protein
MLVARRDSVKSDVKTDPVNRIFLALAGSGPLKWVLIVPFAFVTNVVVASVA